MRKSGAAIGENRNGWRARLSKVHKLRRYVKAGAHSSDRVRLAAVTLSFPSNSYMAPVRNVLRADIVTVPEEPLGQAKYFRKQGFQLSLKRPERRQFVLRKTRAPAVRKGLEKFI